MKRKKMIISFVAIMSLLAGIIVCKNISSHPKASRNCKHTWEKVKGEGHL